MHDAVIVVGAIEMRHLLVAVLTEIAFGSVFDIFPLNRNVIVSIICALHVIEAKR